MFKAWAENPISDKVNEYEDARSLACSLARSLDKTEAADALQSVARLNHLELNLNIVTPDSCGLSAAAQKMLVKATGPPLPR